MASCCHDNIHYANIHILWNNFSLKIEGGNNGGIPIFTLILLVL